MRAPLPHDELERLAALRAYKVLDTPAEGAFDRITRLAARMLDAPVALVTLIDEDRQWFKAAHGVEIDGSPREFSLCAHTILSPNVLAVPNAEMDERFSDNPFVTGAPYVRSYAGAPLITPSGKRLGALCVVDLKPREFTENECAALADLAAMVVDELEFRLVVRRLDAEVGQRQSAEATAAELRNASLRHSILAAAIQSSDTGLLISDPNQPDNPAIFVNEAFQRISGYAEAEVLGQNCRFLQGPETSRPVIAEMREAIAHRKPFRGLLLNYRKDGNPFWNELHVDPVFDEHGRLMNFFGLQHDVSERVLAQHALRESEQRLQAILDNTTSVIYVKGLDGRMQMVNRRYRALFQAPFGNELRDAEPFHAPAIERKLRENDLKVIEAKAPMEFEEEVMQGGQLHHYLSVKFPLFNAAGAMYAICGISTDITARKSADLALKQSEARKRGILDVALDAVITIDHEGVVLETNPATEQIFGYTAAEMMGQELAALIIPPALREAHRAGMRNFLKTGEGPVFGKRLELPAMRKDGSEFPVEIAINRIALEGPPMFTGHMRDITARKRNDESLRLAKEEAERANAAKSEFLSRMSHELRTPLNAILGFGQLLQRRALPEREAESVDFIVKGGRHLLDLINDVLDLTQIESGRASISLEPVELLEVLLDCLNLVRSTAEARRIGLQIAREEFRGRYVMADRQRLTQVLLNLLSNAVKYNREGGHVAVALTSARGECWRIAVQDAGRGMSQEKQARLFVPFERLGMETEGIEGYGIGLALTQQLVALMDGSIEVESVEGAGSCFAVVLPQAPPPELSARAEDAPPAAEAACGVEQKTVLYVEDNPANLRLMERMARECPIVRLVSVTRGSEALAAARAQRPALILLDLHLPDLSGEEVLAQLQMDGALREVPVVIVSADAMSRQVKRLLQNGAREYLTKPIDLGKLLSVFGQFLKPQP